MIELMFPLWRRFALNSLISGDYEKAEKYFRKIHRYNPNEPGFDYNLGLVKLAQFKYEDAESYFKNDISLYGESYERLRVMGDLYYVWGKREEAASWYEKALQECKNEIDKSLIKARLHNCSKIESFNNVVLSYRYYNEGNKLLESKEDEEALNLFSKAVELDNTNFQALNNKGSILMNYSRDYKKAEECFLKASRISNLPSIQKNLVTVQKILAEEERKE